MSQRKRLNLEKPWSDSGTTLSFHDTAAMTAPERTGCAAHHHIEALRVHKEASAHRYTTETGASMHGEGVLADGIRFVFTNKPRPPEQMEDCDE